MLVTREGFCIHKHPSVLFSDVNVMNLDCMTTKLIEDWLVSQSYCRQSSGICKTEFQQSCFNIILRSKIIASKESSYLSIIFGVDKLDFCSDFQLFIIII